MKCLPLILLTSLTIITSACGIFSKEELEVNNDIKQIIFFSNESDYSQEAAYYDALIELKKQFPEDLKNMLVLSSSEAKPYYKAYHVDSSPAILVLYENKVILKINGNITKDEIIDPMSEVLTSSASVELRNNNENIRF